MDLHSHHVIEASAGTGKTFLIEHRVVDLIVRRGLELKDILIVTFTEKATAELKHRICEIISKVLGHPYQEQANSKNEGKTEAWNIDEDALLRLQKSLEQSETAAISTIHGFCQRILRETSLKQGRASKTNVAPPWQLFRQAVEACIDDTFSTQPELIPYLRAFLLNAPIQNKPREELLALLHQGAHFGGNLKPSFDKKELLKTATALQTSLKKKRPEQWGTDSFKNGSVRKAISSRLSALNELLGDTTLDWPVKLARLPALNCKYILEKKSDSEEMLGLQHNLGNFLSQALSLNAILTQLFLPFVHKRSIALKSEYGAHDFNDMIEKAHLQFTGSDSKVLIEHVVNQHPCAFIDEFQDTDKKQWEIFKNIYINNNEASLTVVGDPKQSIYGFRGADLETYFEAKRCLLENGGQELHLEVNYRSSPGLIKATNNILTSDTPFFSGEVRYEKPVKAGLDCKIVNSKGDELEPLVLMHIEEKDLKITALKDKLLDAIPNQIRHILDKNKPLQVSQNGHLKTVQARDIMVLTRTSAESQVLAKMCQGQGIPVSVFQNDALFLSKEAAELRDLFYAIESPHESRWLHRAMLSRFCRWAPEWIRANKHSNLFLSWKQTFNDWHDLASKRDMSRLLSSIKTQSSFFSIQTIVDESRRSLINMHHLFELLLDSHPSGKWVGGGIADWIQEHITQARMPLGFDVPKERLGSDLNAVQIMTFHKAKGLEAEIVFLFGLLSSPKKKWATDLIDKRQKETWLGDLPATKENLNKTNQKAENERLIYVAMTRAKSRLYLPYVSNSKKAITGSYSLLNDRLDGMTQMDTTLLQSVDTRDESTKTENAKTDLSRFYPSNPKAHVLQTNNWKKRKRLDKTSYSKLSHSLPPSPSTFKEGFIKKKSGTAHGTLTRGAETGIWLHNVLEKIDIKTIATASDFEEWYEISRKNNHIWNAHAISKLEQEEWARLLYKGFHTSLKTDATDLGLLHSLTNSSREINFLFAPDPPSATPFFEGSIDFVFQKHQTLYLIDWKSDVLTQKEEDDLKATTLEKYSLQATIYSEALRRLSKDEIEFGGVFYFYLRYSKYAFIDSNTIGSFSKIEIPPSLQRKAKS